MYIYPYIAAISTLLESNIIPSCSGCILLQILKGEIMAYLIELSNKIT